MREGEGSSWHVIGNGCYHLLWVGEGGRAGVGCRGNPWVVFAVSYSIRLTKRARR